jgi:hypothetical protein
MVTEFFKLIKEDPDNAYELKEAIRDFDSLVERGSFSLDDDDAKALRQLIRPGALVSLAECTGISSRVGEFLESSSVNLTRFQTMLETLCHNPSYLSIAMGADMLMHYLEDEVDRDGDRTSKRATYMDGDEDDVELLSGLSKKLSVLSKFLSESVANGDVYLGAMILELKAGPALQAKDEIGGDELWIQRTLIREINSKKAHNRLSKAVIYLKAMLMYASPEQVVSVCDISDDARRFGYNLTRNTVLLDRIKSESALSETLEQDLGL